MASPHIWVPTKRAASKFWSHRAEALSLYREILRTAKHFHWCDENGQPWNKRLKEQARQEFEASREETDPLILARLLVTGRDCVQQIQQRFNAADRACWDRIRKDSTGSRWKKKQILHTKTKLGNGGNITESLRQMGCALDYWSPSVSLFFDPRG